jgi:hypothetical protein
VPAWALTPSSSVSREGLVRNESVDSSEVISVDRHRFFPACSIGHPQRGLLQPPSPPKSALNSRRLRAPRAARFDSRG